MPLPKNFQSFAEFEREILRQDTRLGLSLEDMVEDEAFEAEIESDTEDPSSPCATTDTSQSRAADDATSQCPIPFRRLLPFPGRFEGYTTSLMKFA